VYLGQRVAVMTSRPGRIKNVVRIDLDRPDEPDSDLRSEPEFTRYRRQIWDLLHTEVRRAGELEEVGVR